MPSTLVNRNVTVAGRRTSIRLEPLMWQALEEVARARNQTIHELCSEVDARRGDSSLTAAIRCALLAHYRDAAAAIGGLERPAGGGTDPRTAAPSTDDVTRRPDPDRYNGRASMP